MQPALSQRPRLLNVKTKVNKMQPMRQASRELSAASKCATRAGVARSEKKLEGTPVRAKSRSGTSMLTAATMLMTAKPAHKGGSPADAGRVPPNRQLGLERAVSRDGLLDLDPIRGALRQAANRASALQGTHG